MKFAIIGATGNVGRKTIDILEKSSLDVKELFLVASKKSSGKKKDCLSKLTLRLHLRLFQVNWDYTIPKDLYYVWDSYVWDLI